MLSLPTLALVAAKKKKKKKRRTVMTVRQPLTQTFTNPGLIDVPTSLVNNPALANPYPSIIEVSGFANGTILDVDVTLHGFTWDEPPAGGPDDADILLTASHLPGTNAMIMSDIGGGDSVTNVTLALDDEAAEPLPDQGPLASGTFQPANQIGGFDPFPAPAPAPIGNSSLSVFDGANPNGTWQLFVVDDFGSQDPGSIQNGWSLRITAEVDAPAPRQRKKKKRRRGTGKR
jgi:hypothetical protein